MTGWKASERAAALHREALVWDNTLPFSPVCGAQATHVATLGRMAASGYDCVDLAVASDTANMAADKGTAIVPTLAVIAALPEEGEVFGHPRESLDKPELIKDDAIERLDHMKRAGIRIGFGTDLIGAIQPRQCIEFGLRANVFSNFEILQQATAMNAEIIGMKGGSMHRNRLAEAA